MYVYISEKLLEYLRYLEVCYLEVPPFISHVYCLQFIESYLRAYRVPQGIRIRDATWSVFINELVSRFPYHPYLLTFLKSIAEHYRIEKRAHEFIMDLLQLNVPKLFAVEPGELEEDAQAVAMEFTSFLYDFINRNALKPAILTQLTSIMVRTYVYKRGHVTGGVTWSTIAAFTRYLHVTSRE